jgi:hypothetical protein
MKKLIINILAVEMELVHGGLFIFYMCKESQQANQTNHQPQKSNFASGESSGESLLEVKLEKQSLVI